MTNDSGTHHKHKKNLKKMSKHEKQKDFMRQKKRSRKKGLSKADKKLLKNIELAGKIVLKEDAKLLEELGKEARQIITIDENVSSQQNKNNKTLVAPKSRKIEQKKTGSADKTENELMEEWIGKWLQKKVTGRTIAELKEIINEIKKSNSPQTKPSTDGEGVGSNLPSPTSLCKDKTVDKNVHNQIYEPVSIEDAINSLQVFLESDLWSKFKNEKINGKTWVREDKFESEEELWDYLDGHFKILRKEINGFLEKYGIRN